MSIAAEVANDRQDREAERLAKRRIEWLDVADAVSEFVSAHPDVDPPYALDYYSEWGDQWTTRVWWITNGAEATRTLIRVLGDGRKVDSGHGQYLLGESHGFRWAISRSDQSCDLVPTDEFEEVEETEVVRPAETRTVTVTRPKMRKVCPPILADDEVAS